LSFNSSLFLFLLFVSLFSAKKLWMIASSSAGSDKTWQGTKT